MKILYVQDSLGTGGAERSNAELWYFLREKKVNIKVVVLEHRSVGIEDEILEGGFDVTFLAPGNIVKQTLELKKIIEKYKPDLVHSVLFRAAIRVRLCRALTRFCHIESIVNCSYSPIRYQDPQINSFGLKVYQTVNQRTQSWGTDKFLAITKEVKRHAENYIGIPGEKIEVINRGRNENPFLNFREKNGTKLQNRQELGLSSDEIILIHVGRQEYQKGHISLLKAIEKNDTRFQELNVHFIFCGREGNETKKIKEFLQNHHLLTKISWLGHRSDVLKILVASDAFVFPSLFEGLGGALLEAQAAALPIICSNIEVFKEVVNKDENAFLFEVGNDEKLSQLILTLAESPSMRQEMGRKSLENFRKKFLIDEIHEKMMGFYNAMNTRFCAKKLDNASKQ